MEYFFDFEKLSYVKGRKPEGCIFCLIRDGSDEIPNLSVFEDELFFVSVNLYPYNPGHLIIFPKRHIEDIRSYTAEEDRRICLLTRYFVTILHNLHNPCGFNIGYNMGKAAGASISHLHLHIIPRYPNETGIADLLAGKRVLVESPLDTVKKIKDRVSQEPLSSFST